ncbi:nucleoside triphosphate pyrophosphohydrolase [Silanimonas sp.]|uniref:nucleoside triphosphate pyrophosphohydrolase n=1 Tax=Silanimonas sp. TaxID=1929290 RepID=UPI0022BAAF00|nr:nucleoside triphosphate pyrophosphohydrolase [Silanimonas sp.]MCZ8166791.1 nucleoside triphosphate pyrophosphohydrolase [Silanimonas sp.]
MSDAPRERIETLLAVMARLRDPERGCPWDVKQDFASIATYTIEEAYEVAEAIDRGDLGDLKDELGDLLLQVVFHAQMANEHGAFGFADVVAAINDKMIRRHPHVFGDASVEDADAQTAAWEKMKAAERAAKRRDMHAPPSALDDVPKALPEWQRALKLQKRGANVGYDWPDATPVIAKLEEELEEVREALAMPPSPERQDAVEDEIGDLLFVAMNLARKAKVDPGTALRRANAKYERRFRQMEALARAQGREFSALSLEEQSALWNEAKRIERGG